MGRDSRLLLSYRIGKSNADPVPTGGNSDKIAGRYGVDQDFWEGEERAKKSTSTFRYRHMQNWAILSR